MKIIIYLLSILFCFIQLTNSKDIEEFNIGHFIIGESVSNGISKVVKQFIKILR